MINGQSNSSVRRKTNISFFLERYRFSEQTLNMVYCTYISPLLEYASEVWDGYSQFDANRLEKAQLDAAWIVTSLPVFKSLKL